MENLGRWKIIKIGFFLGIGFIIPQLIMVVGGTFVSALAIPPMMESAFESEALDPLLPREDNDDLTRIKILNYKEQTVGDRLLILGAIENISDSKASSIQLEAELLNENGEFVYECTEYISKDLLPGDIENYQIRCGCGDSKIPDHTDMTLRVVSVSNY